MALGYDENPGDNKKHYRMYYEDELENISSVMPNKPFHEVDITRGQERGLKKRDGMETSDSRSVGKFKGIIKVTNVGD